MPGYKAKMLQLENAIQKGDKSTKNLLANCALDSGDIIKAKELFNQAIEENPNDSISLSDLGRLYALEENFAKAEELYLRALVNYQGDKRPSILLNIALLHMSAKDFERSIYYCLQAITAGSERGLYIAAIIFREKGDIVTAKKYFNRAVYTTKLPEEVKLGAQLCKADKKHCLRTINSLTASAADKQYAQDHYDYLNYKYPTENSDSFITRLLKTAKHSFFPPYVILANLGKHNIFAMMDIIKLIKAGKCIGAYPEIYPLFWCTRVLLLLKTREETIAQKYFLDSETILAMKKLAESVFSRTVRRLYYPSKILGFSLRNSSERAHIAKWYKQIILTTVDGFDFDDVDEYLLINASNAHKDIYRITVGFFEYTGVLSTDAIEKIVSNTNKAKMLNEPRLPIPVQISKDISANNTWKWLPPYTLFDEKKYLAQHQKEVLRTDIPQITPSL